MGRSSKSKGTFIATRTKGLSANPRAAIYNRVSTDDQDPKLAMEDLHRAARQRGFETTLEVEETGSGKRADRAGLLEIMRAARAGEVQVVVVARLDRFGRSTMDLLANIRALTDAGVRFVCTQQAIDVAGNTDPMGQLVLTIMAAMAQFEHDLITARVRDGVRRAQKRGVKFGRPRASGPSGAEVVGLRAEGRSWSEVARHLGCSVGLARLRATEFNS
jgi:DNA invertase Pin-like site-specific DNA recombinase